MDRVSYTNSAFQEVVLKEATIVCKSGRRVGIYEDGPGTALQALFMLINGLCVPTCNEDSTKGTICVGGVDISKIGTKRN